MIRLGEIVKRHENRLMIVSPNYEDVAKKLASFDFKNDELKLLACLVISQTERQYKKYLISVLKDLHKLPVSKLINDWETSSFEVKDEDFIDLLSTDEYELIKDKDIEDHLEEYEKDYPKLFDDGLNNTFYKTKKKGMLYLRRLIIKSLGEIQNYDSLRQLVLYFVTAQLLDSWESSCILLGMMLLEKWEIENMTKWFNKVWPIYTV